MTYQELHDDLKAKRDQVDAISFTVPEKETFRTELLRICDFLLAINAPTDFSPLTNEEYDSYALLCLKWSERLILSHEYRLNPEMAFCIEQLVSKWNVHKEKKLVIFTLGDFQVLKIKREENKDYIEYLETMSLRTGIPQTYEPVFIRVPDEYKNQMLTNVPLFHEVGHFVDRDNSITDIVYDMIEDDLTKSKTSRFLREHFPRFINVVQEGNQDAEKIIKKHISEYIADIFGAQYAHEYILLPAKYVVSEPAKDDEEHPSLDCRRRFVNVFIEHCKTGNSNNPLLLAILDVLNLINQVELVAELHSVDDLLSDQLVFQNNDELLASFHVAWRAVVLDSKKARIFGRQLADYQKILSLNTFKQIDANIRKATAPLI